LVLEATCTTKGWFVGVSRRKRGSPRVEVVAYTMWQQLKHAQYWVLFESILF
jgi:hypothetical protein